MKVIIITKFESDLLKGELYTTDSYFNPIQDLNDNWIISEEEVIQCSNEEFNWIKERPLIDYEPKVNEMI